MILTLARLVRPFSISIAWCNCASCSSWLGPATRTATFSSLWKRCDIFSMQRLPFAIAFPSVDKQDNSLGVSSSLAPELFLAICCNRLTERLAGSLKYSYPLCLHHEQSGTRWLASSYHGVCFAVDVVDTMVNRFSLHNLNRGNFCISYCIHSAVLSRY